jgi:hypothetical protein
MQIVDCIYMAATNLDQIIMQPNNRHKDHISLNENYPKISQELSNEANVDKDLQIQIGLTVLKE